MVIAVVALLCFDTALPLSPFPICEATVSLNGVFLLNRFSPTAIFLSFSVEIPIAFAMSMFRLYGYTFRSQFSCHPLSKIPFGVLFNAPGNFFIVLCF